MTAEDSAQFVLKLTALGEIFGVKISAARAALYFEALADLSLEDVLRGLKAAAQGNQFFPKPVEIRTLAVGDSEDRIEDAWLRFKAAMAQVGSYASLAVTDAALGETILSMFGSWPAACQAELSPEMWASKRKEFGRTYRVMVQRGLSGSRYLAGQCERLNAGRQDWLKFVQVAQLGPSGVRLLTKAEADEARQLMAAESHEMTSIAAQSVRRLVDGGER